MRIYHTPGAFLEGTCVVNGTIDGTEVTGKAFIELIHAWKNHIIVI